jgi:predicted dehydrogenase
MGGQSQFVGSPSPFDYKIYPNQIMKIAIIGNWGHHVCVLEETDLMPEAQVVGLAPGIPEEDLSSLQTKYPKAETYAAHHSMFAAMQPDVVLISTRLDRIAPLAIDTARAGYHSICEKPLALDQATLRSLWDAVIENRTQCLAMLPSRTHPVLAAAKAMVNAGRIGDVKLLNARKSYKCANQPAGWIGQRATYGGTLPWIGIHALDFIQAITGCGFSSVSALHANVAHPLQPDREDICTMSLRLSNGAMATASIDYLRPQSAPSHGDDWLRIVGTEGSIEAAMERNCLTVFDATGVHEVTEFESRQPYFPPILQKLPRPGEGEPTIETRRSFALTHTALSARDAGDACRIITDLTGPWNV